MGIEDRLRRLEAANPDLCEGRPCKGPITRSQHRLMPDGTVEVSGEPPPVLCDGCPERGADGPPLHLAWLHGFPPTENAWEVAGIESGAGTAVIKVIVDD